MLSFDTEATGLFLQNGCTTFAIGVFDGRSFNHIVRDIDPVSRSRTSNFPQSIRKRLDAADLLVAHNARFDIKALCEAGILSWEEPSLPVFWSKILDTTQLGHLYCSTDELALDALTKKYLNRGYETENELVKTVNLCRALVRRLKLPWDIAEREGKHPSFALCGSANQWNRMDYWLPAAVLKHIPASQRPKLPDALLRTVLLRYLQDDCINTYELAEFYCHQLTERHGHDIERLLNVNKQVEHIVWKMETKGLYVRMNEVEDGISACQHYIRVLSETTREISGIDHITDHNLRELLFQKWRLKPSKFTKGGKTGNVQPSVDAATILSLHNNAKPGTPQHRFFCCLLSKRKYEKKLAALQSYRHNRDSNGRTHPSFNITGTRTTRFSSSNPNSQNITKAGNPYDEEAPDIAKWLRASPSMRSCFGPQPGNWFVDCDYSQLQLRIFAYVSKEQQLIDALHNGHDFHDFVARKLFEVPEKEKPTKAQRRIAKNCVFGILFGASERKIDATAGAPGMYQLLVHLFPNAHAFIEETKALIRQQGFVTTFGDYPLALRDYFNKHTGTIEKAAHAGVNYIVQGTEGVIVKRAMSLCDTYLNTHYPDGRIALQCHDEIVFEVPARIPKHHVRNLKSLMEQAASDYGVHAPVDAELCVQSWDRSVKVKL